MQSAEILDKSVKNAKRFKDFIFPSGKKVRIQGYENVGINHLLNIYDENDIIVSSDGRLSINYVLHGKNKKYFPDIFIKSTNTIYEVKSTWTLKTHEIDIQAKRLACIKERI